jgi:NAD+ synthase (glutamine-hydrolysing)
MKIALAQLNYHIGNFENNIAKIKEAIDKAKSENADLVVFAELAVSGYPPRDFLEFNDFVNKCNLAINEIADYCSNIAAVIGAPTFNQNKKGKKLYNSAYFINDKKIEKIINKTLLPTYDIFDEYRYFEPNAIFDTIKLKGKKIAITICEDLWNVDGENLYQQSPMDELIKLNPDLLINIAASPFHWEQEKIRKQILKSNAEKYAIDLVYVNHIGAQTELLFDGGSMAINKNSEIVQELSYFKEDLKFVDFDFYKKITENNQSKISKIKQALEMGVKNYFDKLGFKKAILGLSGGIDSAVTLVIAANALGSQNVKAILMPSQFSSQHSIDDSIELANNLGVEYEIVKIENTYKSFEKDLEPYFMDLDFGIAEENIQARIRGVLLMAFSNKFGYILLNTSNKSEAAVGYGTLYGDMNGGLSVLGDVYKSEVFELARYMNKDKEVIPDNIITKPPSAELRPDQKDSDSLPDYDILDRILFEYIENRKDPQQIIDLGFESEIVMKTLRLVNNSEHKRYQAPPILRVSKKAFGMGRRMPIVAKYLNS